MKIFLGICGSIAATVNKKLVDQIFEDLDPERLYIYYTDSAKKILGDDTKKLIPWYFDRATTYLSKVTIVNDSDEWDDIRRDHVLHVELGKVDLIIVAPATANTVAKLANGFADNLLTCAILAKAITTEVVIAPAMNTNMWTNPITQENISKLTSRKCMFHIVPPCLKVLYCGDVGEGALADVKKITMTAKFIPGLKDNKKHVKHTKKTSRP